MKLSVLKIAQNAQIASFYASRLTTLQKNKALSHIAQALRAQSSRIIEANEKDLTAGREKGLSAAMLERLTLNERRVEEMAKAVEEVVELADPVGQVVKEWTRPNHLQIQKVRIPLGVIGIIYESRPNVTVDAAVLCLKSSNAVVLRGGSEAIHSNLVLGEILREVLKEEGIHQDLIQVVPVTDREAMKELLLQDQYIDLIIPRGGESLMQFIREHSRIPVVKHDKGVCHVFVDESANLEWAEKICINSKVQRPSVCNALETLLVHEKVAAKFLPPMVQTYQNLGVEVRGCEKTKAICPSVKAATKEDWSTEYLDLIIAIKVVKNLEEAMGHIQKYGSLHTESIVTENKENAERFLREMNSSVVLVNASTRFNDGGQLGLGAEIGISTTKLHAFGPMGLEELTAQKYVVRGEGQIRE
ncbi:MAG: glutamate-5-semialdehyde dehydrogenase [Deltaproteobacteria bacterium]|nr:glutamate-5-semialdehyde dehydrogenase [Deltaproteobacteria bacterium]